MLKRRVLSVMVAGCFWGCGGNVQPWTPPSTRDTKDDPEALRPGYGNAEMHLWWPIAPPEIEALKGVDKAKAGDPHALLALAVLASGDHRDSANYAAYDQRVDQFLTDVKVTVDGASDDWHKGYELHRAMHKVFFPSEKTELGGYELNQSRLTGIFETGHYNCISSAILFTVLARGFGMPVRGVVTPTHAFVEMGAPGGKILEVETTSNTGFDLVHDERFYKEAAASFSSSRGLRPTTLQEYEARKIIQPYQLMAQSAIDSRNAVTEADRARLAEAAAIIDPDDAELAENRLIYYVNDAVALHETKAWRTIVKLFDTVGPAVSAAAVRFAKEPKVMRRVSWCGLYYSEGLMVVGRPEEAVALADDALDHIDSRWEDAEKLRTYYMDVIQDRMSTFMEKQDFVSAAKLISKHLDLCVKEELCSSNLSVVFRNWALGFEREGEWASSRRVLRECLKHLPNDGDCRSRLRDLESNHKF